MWNNLKDIRNNCASLCLKCSWKKKLMKAVGQHGAKLQDTLPKSVEFPPLDTLGQWMILKGSVKVKIREGVCPRICCQRKWGPITKYFRLLIHTSKFIHFECYAVAIMGAKPPGYAAEGIGILTTRSRIQTTRYIRLPLQGESFPPPCRYIVESSGIPIARYTRSRIHGLAVQSPLSDTLDREVIIRGSFGWSKMISKYIKRLSLVFFLTRFIMQIFRKGNLYSTNIRIIEWNSASLKCYIHS